MKALLRKLSKIFAELADGPQATTTQGVPAVVQGGDDIAAQTKPEPTAQEKFEAQVAEQWEKARECKDMLKDMGMVDLEDSFIDQMILGLLPNPNEVFIGGANGYYLKTEDEPPRKIIFIGAIAGNGGGYFTAGFFNDDGKMLSTIAFTTINELHDYLKSRESVPDIREELARAQAEDSGVLGREDKWLSLEDKMTPSGDNDDKPSSSPGQGRKPQL